MQVSSRSVIVDIEQGRAFFEECDKKNKSNFLGDVITRHCLCDDCQRKHTENRKALTKSAIADFWKNR